MTNKEKGAIILLVASGEMGIGLKEHLEAMRKAVRECQDIEELMKLQDSLRDVLIEMMPFLINTEKRIGKKDKLRRSFLSIVADRHGV